MTSQFASPLKTGLPEPLGWQVLKTQYQGARRWETQTHSRDHTRNVQEPIPSRDMPWRGSAAGRHRVHSDSGKRAHVLRLARVL